MNKKIAIILVIAIFFAGLGKSFAQADTLLKFCARHLPKPYISDGQQYQALVTKGEIAEFFVTFYGETTYRVVGCSGLTDGNLIFTIYDKDNNLLFSNRDYKNSPYWDFKFTSTVECRIEAELDDKGPDSGVAILLIGFKQGL